MQLKLLILLAWAVLLAACGGAVEPTAVPTPTLTAQETLGKTVFQQHCASCHSNVADQIIVGPSLFGVGERAASRVPGQDAQTYLLTSIMNPNEYVVEGFDNLMTEGFAKSLTGEEIDAVVAYLLTLK
ncbi:MAG TPA: cytochrome c [Anaerolineae bacterium]|nr:cytochrome c [Anaerolineae bacterium]